MSLWISRAAPLGLAWLSVLVIAFWPVARDQFLYASTLWVLLCFFVFLHAETMRGVRWGDPPSVEANTRQRNWEIDARMILASVVLSGVTMTGLLAARVYLERASTGGWFSFYAVLFTAFILGAWRARGYLNVRAAFLSAAIMTLLLAAYENLLLQNDTGWAYHGTQLYSVFYVPIENLLFIYPVASGLCSTFLSIALRRYNPLKAFWILSGLLSIVFIIIEIVGIGWFRLWSVTEFAHKSIWPFWETNIEEFVYYFLFQGVSLLFYLWLNRHLKPEHAP